MTGNQGGLMAAHWVCLDVGETLIDETRVFATWADVLGVPRFTFAAVLGGVLARGGSYLDVFTALGVDDWREHDDEVQETFGGFQAGDLYPDALPSMTALRDSGYRLAVIANQPARRDAELRALGVRPEVMAMSEALTVSKPDPVFFGEALRLMGDPDPSEVAYVGDRVDNDVLPSAAAGMRSVWLHRGPWGFLHRDPDGVAALEIRSLAELVRRVEELWP